MTRKIALLTAGVNADNAGDSFIEDAVRRIVSAEEFLRFPLTSALTGDQIADINECDVAIVCGTNLYQSEFACNLTEPVIETIKCPIVPFGIGSSAEIGRIPRMSRAGRRAVAALHQRCVVSSVRDRASHRFLESIGVKNVVLTGCPVLFHALKCPDFPEVPEGVPTLSVRARLLHLKAGFESRQSAALHELCARYHPRLVIQSPYDRELANEMARAYDLLVVDSPTWSIEPYLDCIKGQSWTAGFRLHFGMLSLSYGTPAWFVAHDSRVSEFCELVGLPYFDIRDFKMQQLLQQISERVFPADTLRLRWTDLATSMRAFLRLNALDDRLEISQRMDSPSDGLQQLSTLRMDRDRPKVLFLVDRPNWAFDHSARHLKRELSDGWDVEIRYVIDGGRPQRDDYDLLYVFFWGEASHQAWSFDPLQVIKEVSSHRWEDDERYGPCTPTEMSRRFLREAATVACTSRRLVNLLTPYHPAVRFAPNGIDPHQFKPVRQRIGLLSIGWAGNIRDAVKGVAEVLIPACADEFQFEQAPGDRSHSEMNEFYNRLDVFVVASRHEGEPLTLIEAMAAGCFPVCNDIGIVPELVTHGENGWIVAERTPEAYRAAFRWCQQNLEAVRSAGLRNATRVRVERSWSAMSAYYRTMLGEAWSRSQALRFRNDDVSWDTDLNSFEKFCRVFGSRGLRQLHGVTLYGRTNALFVAGDSPAEYVDSPPLSAMPNAEIRDRSRQLSLATRTDLCSFLAAGNDDIALHGLFHTDYSQMSFDEQCRDIEKGLTELEALFPSKPIRYFIPPFNRINRHTKAACDRFQLHLLGTDGVHLEEQLERLCLYRGVWHRYHHHRFYPESTFHYYALSLNRLERALDEALARGVCKKPEKTRGLWNDLARYCGQVSQLLGTRSEH